MSDPVVIVGAGQAAAQLVVALRQKGFAGRIQLVGDEPHLPYQRPPLSKAFLVEDVPLDRLHLRPESYYGPDTELLLGRRVDSVDASARSALLDDGRALPYGTLVLATGGRPRRLEVPGHELAGIHHFRTIADAEAVRAALAPGARLAVVGGGYVGLEVAAAARKRGATVHLFEVAPRLLSRVASPVVAAFFLGRHRAAGVDIRLGASAVGFAGKGRVSRVRLADGSEVEVDAVVVGIGIAANVELGAACGCAVDNGLVVGRDARTNVDGILAIGDCTAQWSEHLGRHLRLESVPNANAQAEAAAATILGAAPAATPVPWFWSEQYDAMLQMVGVAREGDESVVRGDPVAGPFTEFYLSEGRLVAAACINRAPDFALLRRQLAGGPLPVDARALADPAVPLRTALAP